MAKADAEVGAMHQALEAGVSGGEATLRVKGDLTVCRACRGDVKTMARKLGLEKLTVVDADGKVYSFVGDELKPLPQGKPWK